MQCEGSNVSNTWCKNMTELLFLHKAAVTFSGEALWTPSYKLHKYYDINAILMGKV